MLKRALTTGLALFLMLLFLADVLLILALPYPAILR